jgi:hypothetical protein
VLVQVSEQALQLACEQLRVVVQAVKLGLVVQAVMLALMLVEPVVLAVALAVMLAVKLGLVVQAVKLGLVVQAVKLGLVVQAVMLGLMPVEQVLTMMVAVVELEPPCLSQHYLSQPLPLNLAQKSPAKEDSLILLRGEKDHSPLHSLQVLTLHLMSLLMS